MYAWAYSVFLVDGINHLCPGCKCSHITVHGWLLLLLVNEQNKIKTVIKKLISQQNKMFTTVTCVTAKHLTSLLHHFTRAHLIHLRQSYSTVHIEGRAVILFH